MGPDKPGLPLSGAISSPEEGSEHTDQDITVLACRVGFLRAVGAEENTVHAFRPDTRHTSTAWTDDIMMGMMYHVSWA